MRWWWFSISVILVLLATINCDPLDKTENEQRLKSCGRGIQSKVFNGRDAQQSEAPWSVFHMFLHEDGKTSEMCTGTIVSTRHILISTHCFANQHNETGDWLFNGQKMIGSSNCQNDNYVINDKEAMKRITLRSDGKVVARAPEKVTLVNACIPRIPVKTAKYNNTNPQMYVDDFAIIDLYEDLVYSPTVQTVCVADGRKANVVGTKLDYYGFGHNPKKGLLIEDSPDTSGVLRHESIEVMDQWAEEYFFLAADPTNKKVACPGDSGGGAIGKDANGRKTIIGVLSQTNCANPAVRGKRHVEQYASVGYYNEIICKLTGICINTKEHEKNHNGYTKKEKSVRNPEDLVPPKQNGQVPGQNVEYDQNGNQIIRQQKEPDSAIGNNLNLIFGAILFGFLIFN